MISSYAIMVNNVLKFRLIMNNQELKDFLFENIIVSKNIAGQDRDARVESIELSSGATLNVYLNETEADKSQEHCFCSVVITLPDTINNFIMYADFEEIIIEHLTKKYGKSWDNENDLDFMSSLYNIHITNYIDGVTFELTEKNTFNSLFYEDIAEYVKGKTFKSPLIPENFETHSNDFDADRTYIQHDEGNMVYCKLVSLNKLNELIAFNSGITQQNKPKLKI